MKDIRNLTEAERQELFKLLKPIGYEEGEELHICEIWGDGERSFLKEIESKKE